MDGGDDLLGVDALYRFTVVVPLAKKAEAKPLVERFLAGLTFQKDSAATGDK